jgi:shikimate kinase
MSVWGDHPVSAFASRSHGPASALPEDGHLVLVGLPGAGKSTIGRKLAQELGRPFLDFDAEIERRSGMTVARLFVEQGEPAFRAREVALTRELSAAPPMVLAPGGGWVTNPEVMSLVRPPGRIIHLKISPEGALRRLSRARVVRPLLRSADPATVMRGLWDKRALLYSQADLELDVEVLDSQHVVREIMAFSRHHLPPGLG